MTKEEKLYLAIGEIDEMLVAEALSPYKKQIFTRHNLTIAASVMLATIVILAGLKFLPIITGVKNDAMGGDANMAPDRGESSDNSAGLYSTIETDFGTVTVIGNEYGKFITLKLELYQDVSPIHITLFGYADNKYYSCTTNKNLTDYTILTPLIKVNGVPSDTLPTLKGVYDISIEFSDIEQVNVYWNDTFIIDGFGEFRR